MVKTLDVGTHIIFVGEAEDAFTESAGRADDVRLLSQGEEGHDAAEGIELPAARGKSDGLALLGVRVRYEGEELPDPFTCPVCGQPREVFVKL